MKTKPDNVNAKTPLGLSQAERAHLARLAALPDESIDTSDFPELSDEAWSASGRGRFNRPVK